METHGTIRCGDREISCVLLLRKMSVLLVRVGYYTHRLLLHKHRRLIWRCPILLPYLEIQNSFAEIQKSETYTCIHIHQRIHMYSWLICMFASMHTSMYVNFYVCMHVCMYVCMYIYLLICLFGMFISPLCRFRSFFLQNEYFLIFYASKNSHRLATHYKTLYNTLQLVATPQPPKNEEIALKCYGLLFCWTFSGLVQEKQGS